MGIFEPLNGKIETLITRSDKNRQLMTYSEKEEKSNYKL